MSGILQNYLAEAAGKAQQDLLKALDGLPQDKRDWKASGDARTALDQVAECAILNGGTAELLRNKSFPPGFDFAQFQAAKDSLAADETALRELLVKNTEIAMQAIREVPDSEFDISIDMPWGAVTVKQIMAYPFWNMCY